MFPTTMKLPNEERTLIFVLITLLKYNFGSNYFPGPDFDEDEWQEWFQAREEDNVKKKRKEVSEPGTAENSLQDGSAKVIGHPAKTTSRAFSEVRMNATRTNDIIMIIEIKLRIMKSIETIFSIFFQYLGIFQYFFDIQDY
ncbi:hypothetical protein EDD18DRAFT_1102669 [Armillaria luteobubalina]|uniref:Uncharacterized protein n=1 Tax=Armillaria luteobubalina TaxID=153913 RepID=A0AA39QAI2_9AGAR|nr:hypothetical protein EDD18DRAFT_1102669 [Armillaria luteobubalina]